MYQLKSYLSVSGLLVLDAKGEVLSCNPVLAEVMFGEGNSEEIVGKVKTLIFKQMWQIN